MKNSEIVEGAIERIEAQGWARGLLQQLDGRFCMLGAALAAHRGTNTLNGQLAMGGDEMMRLTNALGVVLPPGGSGNRVTYFNDRVANSKDEVIEILTRAAKYWRDRGE